MDSGVAAFKQLPSSRQTATSKVASDDLFDGENLATILPAKRTRNGGIEGGRPFKWPAVPRRQPIAVGILVRRGTVNFGLKIETERDIPRAKTQKGARSNEKEKPPTIQPFGQVTHPASAAWRRLTTQRANPVTGGSEATRCRQRAFNLETPPCLNEIGSTKAHCRYWPVKSMPSAKLNRGL